METAFRADLLTWLRADPMLASELNAIAEEAPLRTALPWLGIVASASRDWSTKERAGREIRVAIELHCRGDTAEQCAALVRRIEQVVSAMPASLSEAELVAGQFLRARSEQRPGNIRAVLLEYRFRLLAA